MRTTDIIIIINQEISFYKRQIKENLGFVSQYERYVNNNEDYIKENPDKEEEFFREAYYNFHSYFPYLVNNSLLVAFDSYLEYKLQLIFKEFCIEKEKKKNISCIDYYFNNIYLNYKINLTEINNDLGLIKDLHKVRNRIVHENSSLSKKYQPSIIEIRKAVNSETYRVLRKYKSDIEYNEITTRFFITNTHLLIRYLDSIEEILSHILQKINKN